MRDYDDAVEEDLSISEQAAAVANLPKKTYLPGHPVFVSKGGKLVQAEPGSKEAGYKRLGGPNLVKI